MVASIQQKLTFEEFLNWDDGSDRAFELIQGIAMPLREPTAKIDLFPTIFVLILSLKRQALPSFGAPL